MTGDLNAADGRQVLRFELQPDQGGCLLIFTHAFDDRAGAASFAAGWQGCLDALQPILDGQPATWPTDYVERHEANVRRFGLDTGSIQETADGWLVRFERQLPYPRETVWALLTEAEPTESAASPEAGSSSEASTPTGAAATSQTGAPAPDATEIAVGSTPPLRFTNGYVPADTVTASEPRSLLEYGWCHEGRAVGRVRWPLSDGPGGARITLTQTVPAALPDLRVTALAAWHTHLELLARYLGGDTRCWEPDRTERLKRQYATTTG